MPTIPVTAAVPSSSTDQHTEVPMPNDHCLAATYASKKKCYFCSDSIHHRRSCPACNSVCNNCGKKGHYGKVCMSKATSSTTASLFSPTICSITAACPKSLSHASVNVSVYGNTLSALIDSGSSDSFISQTVAEQLNLKIHPSTQDITMALTSLKTHIIGHCFADINLNQRVYKSTRLGVLKDLCSDIILGHDFQKEHERFTIEFGGRKPKLIIPNSTPICAISAATIDEPSLFSNLLPDCKPIASKSRRFSKDDQDFIQQEVTKHLSEDIIEISSSPWHAQVVVAKDPLNQHKERLCIDYSQTINQYTDLDAYPLPRIDDMVNNLAAYKVYSTFDLKSAYHQVPIKESDRKYTGVAVFQRAMDKMVDEEGLKDTFPYLDNITVAGRNQQEHDENVKKFHVAIQRRNLTLNKIKSVENKSSINILGYCVGDGIVKPDQERLRLGISSSNKHWLSP